MASNIKKDSFLYGCAVLSIFLCIVAVIGGFLLSAHVEKTFSVEKIERIEIGSVDDLTFDNETMFKNNLILTNDIHITNNSFSIGTNERPFSGTFNGNGYTVYCDFEKREDANSLFGCVASQAVIENTNFVFDNVEVAESAYGGIAQINYGTIKNCTIKYNNLIINNDSGLYSPTVIINRGIISNIVVECTFTTNQEIINEKAVAFGTICAYNYGSINNIIAIPKYSGFKCTNEYNILIGDYVNTSISAICAYKLNEGKNINFVAIIGDDIYTSDKYSLDVFAATSKTEVFTAEKVFDELDFDNRYWDLSDAEYTLTLKTER